MKTTVSLPPKELLPPLEWLRNEALAPLMGGGTSLVGELQSRSNSSTELVSSRPGSGAFGVVVTPANNMGATFEYPASVLESHGVINPAQYGMHHPQQQQQQQPFQYGVPPPGQYPFPAGFAPQSPYGAGVYHQISSSVSSEYPSQPQFQQYNGNDVVMNENEADLLLELMDTFDDGPAVLTSQPTNGSAVSSISNASSIESGRTSNSSTVNLGNTMHRTHPDQRPANGTNKMPFNFNLMCSTEKSKANEASGVGDKSCTTFFCGSL